MQNPVFVAWLHLKFLIDIHTPLITVSMAEWLDGHLGSSGSRVETLLE